MQPVGEQNKILAPSDLETWSQCSENAQRSLIRSADPEEFISSAVPQEERVWAETLPKPQLLNEAHPEMDASRMAMDVADSAQALDAPACRQSMNLVETSVEHNSLPLETASDSFGPDTKTRRGDDPSAQTERGSPGISAEGTAQEPAPVECVPSPAGALMGRVEEICSKIMTVIAKAMDSQVTDLASDEQLGDPLCRFGSGEAMSYQDPAESSEMSKTSPESAEQNLSWLSNKKACRASALLPDMVKHNIETQIRLILEAELAEQWNHSELARRASTSGTSTTESTVTERESMFKCQVCNKPFARQCTLR